MDRDRLILCLSWGGHQSRREDRRGGWREGGRRGGREGRTDDGQELVDGVVDAQAAILVHALTENLLQGGD